MTVAELIAQLQELPGNAPVEISAYRVGDDGDFLLNPELAEGFTDGEGGVKAVIWATLQE